MSDELEAEIDGLKAVSDDIIRLGDYAESMRFVWDASIGLSGFACHAPLSQLPDAVSDAEHTISGRFFVLGDLMRTSADLLHESNEAVAKSIRAAGELNAAPGSK